MSACFLVFLRVFRLLHSTNICTCTRGLLQMLSNKYQYNKRAVNKDTKPIRNYNFLATRNYSKQNIPLITAGTSYLFTHRLCVVYAVNNYSACFVCVFFRVFLCVCVCVCAVDAVRLAVCYCTGFDV